jgi:Ca-activated chloride channel family protein
LATTTVATSVPVTTTDQGVTSTTVRATGNVTLDFEAEVQAGTEFDVTWTGPDNRGDYVTIVPDGADEGTYLSYFETAAGPTGTIYAPTTAGDYEVRYVDGATSATLASSPITLTGRSITLELPITVVAGTSFQVTWEAIDAPQDYITIVPEGADEGSYTSYFYTSEGSTGTLIAPIEEGDYEIRYVSGLDDTTVATSAMPVTPLEITIDAPSVVAAGSQFEVAWTGPNGPSDYLTVVPLGADPGTYGDYAYTTEGPTLTLIAPEEPGEYEIRYQSDRVPGVFFSTPITVS